MNERIERLAFKVMDEPVDLGRTHLKIDVVRFAELIVKECAEFSFKYAGDLKAIQDCEEVDLNLSLCDIRNATKKHFGVE
jgi:hypothetical protein